MSDNIKKIGEETQKILAKEGKKFSEKVAANIRKSYPNNDYIRSNADTIHEDASIDSLIVWGAQYFDNVEKGIPPLFGKYKCQNRNVKGLIYEWTFKAGLSFDSDSKRKSFAWALRQKIGWQGTALYRKGGRKDIYSNEFQPLYDSISAQISNVILKYKLL